MKKILNQIYLAIQRLGSRIRHNPLWLKIYFLAKQKVCFAYQKVSETNTRLITYIQPRLENPIRRLSKNPEFTLSTKATQVIFYVFIYIALSVIWHFIGNYMEDAKSRDARMRPVSVVTADVKLGQITVIQTALGTITPRNTVTVHSQVSGVLSKVLFKEGDLVQAEQQLALIDPRPFEASLKQAEGTLNKDKALLTNAELDLKRYDTLLKQDSISHQVYATQKALVQQYKGNVLTDEGLVSNAKLQLEFAHIKSPINGRIGLRLVDPGNLVQPSDAAGLFVITQLQPTTALFSVPQDVIPAFKKFLKESSEIGAGNINAPVKTEVISPISESEQNKKHQRKNKTPLETNIDNPNKTVNTTISSENVVIPVEAWNGDSSKKLATGHLESIDNQIDITTGTVKLRAIFPNEDMTLFPNQFVNIRIVLDVLNDVVVIPVPAVQRGTLGTFVYRLNVNNTVSVVPVKLGPVDGNNVQVIEGLSAGNIVVVDGTDKLRNSAKVIVGQASTAAIPKGRWRDGQKQKGSQ